MQHHLPKLPSIQSMLEGITLEDDTNKQRTHRRHASEQHSAFKPVQPVPTLEPKVDNIPTSTYHSRIAELQSHHRSPRNLHSRSFSDYTHPYPTSTPPRSSGAQLAPLHPTFHRRAASVNTLDLILQPLMKRPLDQYNPPPQLYTSSSTSSITTSAPRSPIDEHDGYTSDEKSFSSLGSASPPLSAAPVSAPNENDDGDGDGDGDQGKTFNTTIATAAANASTSPSANKYSCPYCDKGFSRPSSLRIHTYSHTGERPFECPESGCSRKFSVQSNMRRHLRVHRLGRPLKRNGGLISPADRAQLINKPLAAKPATPSSNWIGVTIYPA